LGTHVGWEKLSFVVREDRRRRCFHSGALFNLPKAAIVAVWDRQIDGDFADDGRLRSVLEEVRADVRAGRMEEMP
jgi:hypothetical protein